MRRPSAIPFRREVLERAHERHRAYVVSDRDVPVARVDQNPCSALRSAEAIWKPRLTFGDVVRLTSIAQSAPPGSLRTRSISAPADEHQVDEEVKIPGNRLAGHAEARRELCSIQQAALAVRQHGPEPAQGLRRHAQAEGRDVTLEIGADEILAPQQAVAIARGEMAVGKAATQPEPREGSLPVSRSSNGVSS